MLICKTKNLRNAVVCTLAVLLCCRDEHMEYVDETAGTMFEHGMGLWKVSGILCEAAHVPVDVPIPMQAQAELSEHNGL